MGETVTIKVGKYKNSQGSLVREYLTKNGAQRVLVSVDAANGALFSYAVSGLIYSRVAEPATSSPAIEVTTV